jgi:hypothetical protein
MKILETRVFAELVLLVGFGLLLYGLISPFVKLSAFYS